MIHSQEKILKDKWADRFNTLPEAAKTALKEALQDLRKDALARATHSWRKNKGPMALYWKVVGVYAGHIARAIKLFKP